MDQDPTAKPGIPLLQSPFRAPSFSASFKLDEGYSDETRGQTNCDLNPPSDDVMTLPDWLLGHSEADRAGKDCNRGSGLVFLASISYLPSTILELAYSLLRTLRTSSVAAVVDRLTPLLHMDPVVNLPPEITFEIFSYLDATTLLAASAASRAWRCRTMDSRLWKDLYIQEGWGVDTDAVWKFEQEYSEPASPQTRKCRTRHLDSDPSEPKLKKRVPPTWLESRVTGSECSSTKFEDGEQMEADSEGDHHMSDALTDQASSADPLSSPTEQGLNDQAALHYPNTAFQPFLNSSILIRLPNGAAKVNWQHLYKQRRRLEENWLKARYTNFQLPHPSYPEEAHAECVYTLQFSGKWLVSGSRDRTIRVWDLETKRLRYPPLLGHRKSVLCVQFDPSPSEDLIISGSGDTSVILWRFSTGEKLREIPAAHDDSVLNLKYDKRYLVTCSKDMLIKVWNRQELWPTDPDYPSVHKRAGVTYPSYIVDTTDISPSTLEAEMANGEVRKLAPYSLLMTLEGHLAAVNSIQVTDHEIVSASGDRLIKIWNIHNGVCKKTLVGHDKGIACVQFDGRRIISGSNDNTVRIYDHESGVEVACLRGHDSLVRAVQAGFGDPPGADEAMRLEAEAIDNDFYAAQRSGALDNSSNTLRSAHLDTSGSRNSRDARAIGASIPPGGGGGRWGRIVSGSYDEYILIWKRDREGKWVISQRLHQAAAVARASRPPVGRPTQAIQPAQTQTQPQNQIAMVTAHGSPNAGGGSSSSNQSTPQSTLPNQPSQQTPSQQYQPEQPGPSATATSTPQHQTQQPQTAPPPTTTNTTNQPPHRLPHHHHHNRRQALQSVQQLVPRVFKLQFDARKIICSSQDPRIVAWDFACDDEEIIEASQFFAGL